MSREQGMCYLEAAYALARDFPSKQRRHNMVDVKQFSDIPEVRYKTCAHNGLTCAEAYKELVDNQGTIVPVAPHPACTGRILYGPDGSALTVYGWVNGGDVPLPPAPTEFHTAWSRRERLWYTRFRPWIHALCVCVYPRRTWRGKIRQVRVPRWIDRLAERRLNKYRK